MNARINPAFEAIDAYESSISPVFPPLEDVPRQTLNQVAPKDKVVLVSGATLKPVPVAWLWRYWLALKKLHILAGMPGQGKTTIAIMLAAIITTGGRWPDGSPCPIGNVIIWSGEDDPADTLVPRLVAAGADLSRCYFITGAQRNGEAVPFDPAVHLHLLQEQLHAIGGVSLIVVDPVVSAVTGDSHKNTEVRRALQPLVDLAAECNCAILGITHFAKGGQGSDPSQRVVGSVAFTAVARVVMVAAKVKGEDGEDKRVLARSKSNIGPDDGGFEYYLEQVENADGIHASRITWGQSVEGSARELLTDPAEDDGNADAQDICDMLREALAGGSWTPVDTAQHGLIKAGFSKKQVWSASKKLGVIRKKGEGGPRDGWYWRIPESPQDSQDSAQDSQDSSVQNVESWNLGGKTDPGVEVI